MKRQIRMSQSSSSLTDPEKSESTGGISDSKGSDSQTTISNLDSDPQSSQPKGLSKSEFVEFSLIGKTLAGRYKIKSIIGEGGFGRVYLAEHLTLDISVAVKVIHQHIARDQDRLKRLDQEAKSLSKLSSPYLVKTLDYGLTPIAYLVMEHVDGVPLSEFIKENGALEIPDAIEVFEQLCKGLNNAHSSNLVHRDLKPGNIIINTANTSGSKNGNKNGNKKCIQVKILDFGIAKVVDDSGDSSNESSKLTLTGEIMGSPAFMSPEQWTSRAVDHRSDIYSLGCVMYEVLSGAPAFNAASSFEYLNMHVSQDMKPLSETAPRRKIPPDLEKIVRKCAQKDPQHRYSTCSDILLDLEKLRHGQKLKIKLVKSKAASKRQAIIKPGALFAASMLVFLSTFAGIAYFKRDDVFRHLCNSARLSAEKEKRAGKNDAAIQTLKHAMVWADFLPKQDKERLATMRALGALLKSHGSFAASEELAKKLKNEIGDVDDKQVDLYQHQAVREVDLHRNFAAGIRYGRRAAAMAERHGKNSMIYADALETLGGIYREGRELRAAEATTCESLKITENLLDPMDPSIASRLNDLGLTVGRLGRPVEAENAYLRAIKIGEASHDPELGKYYNNLGTAYQKQMQFTKALAVCKRALEINEKNNGSFADEILGNMGVIAYYTKDYDKAIEYLKKVRQIQKMQGKDKLPGTEGTLLNLVRVYQQLNDHENAVRYLKEALDAKLATNPGDPTLPELKASLASEELLLKKQVQDNRVPASSPGHG